MTLTISSVLSSATPRVVEPEQGRRSGGACRNVGVILGAAERGAKVVKQLLTFARKTGTEHKPLDVDSCPGNHGHSPGNFPKTMNFKLDLDPTLPIIQGDHNQLQQSLINVCLNARDAMPEGGTLSIRTSQAMAAHVRRQFPEADGACAHRDLRHRHRNGR